MAPNGNGLRNHQAEALDLLRGSIAAGKRRVMLQAPTGWGKTKLAAAVVEGALRKGKRIVFTVPALSLIDQTIEMFGREGIEGIGVIQGRHFLTDWSKPVQIASVQTLQRRKLPEGHIAMIDEAHRWFDFYGQWMADPDWKEKPFIGLSATPWTRGLGKFYDDLIIASTTNDLIEAGYLSQFKVFAPSHPDLRGVRTVAGDYHEKDLAAAVDKVPLVADVVETWMKHGRGRPTLCFAVDCAHAKHLQAKFIESGVPTGYIDAYTEQAEREVIKRQFHAGELDVVCNVGCLTTGVDWDVRCISLVRPTKSEILFVQIIGRGLRTAEGKDHCLILDHSDTHLRLGFVTDIHHEVLDDGRERQKAQPRERLPKECSKCTFLKPVGVRKCPNCGHESGPPLNKVKNENGQLVEISNGDRPKFSYEQKQEFFSQLLHYAQTHGYKPGWAYHKYIERFQVRPASAMRWTQPALPEPATLSWIRSRQIAWAKGAGR